MSISADIDRVGLTLLNQRLVNICDEMAVSMMRTAYSPIFSEGLDFTTLLLDKDGNLAATTGINPAMLGASLYAATWMINEVGRDALQPGDVWIHNDPYRGGSHMPEHMMIKPIYYEDELCGYLGTMAHMSEIGGMSAGSFAATATEIYQEGLRLPPVRLFINNEPNRDVWRIMLSNHRTPSNTWGDLHAMLGSLRVGERRLLQLIDERGVDSLAHDMSQLQDYAERHIREELRALPDGDYFAEDFFDNDGVEPGRHYLRLRLIVEGDSIVFDYSDSDPQAAGPINAPYVVTLSASLNALLYLLERRVPVNAGITRAVRVVAPAGSICNVRLPGACVGGQTELQPRVMELITGRIASQILPERAAAGSGNTSLNFLFGGRHPSTGEYFAHYHFEANGWGGRVGSDGNSAQIVPHAACRNTPVEIFESRWPWLHHRYSLREGSAGPGRHRGGLGIVRELEVESDLITVSALADRADSPPWGILGGHDGSTTRIELRKHGTDTFVPIDQVLDLPSKTKFANARLTRGDTVRLVSPSGGGYGDPLERDPHLVALDVENRVINTQQAAADYGVVLDVDGSVKVEATRTARAGGMQ